MILRAKVFSAKVFTFSASGCLNNPLKLLFIHLVSEGVFQKLAVETSAFLILDSKLLWLRVLEKSDL